MSRSKQANSPAQPTANNREPLRGSIRLHSTLAVSSAYRSGKLPRSPVVEVARVHDQMPVRRKKLFVLLPRRSHGAIFNEKGDLRGIIRNLWFEP